MCAAGVYACVFNPAAHPCGAASSVRTSWSRSKIFVKDLLRGVRPCRHTSASSFPVSIFFWSFFESLGLSCQVRPICVQVGPSWEQVGPSWRQDAPCWRQVGAKVAQVGAKMEPTWASRGIVWRFQGIFKFVSIFQPILERFFMIFWCLKTSKIVLSLRREANFDIFHIFLKMLKFCRFLDPTWVSKCFKIEDLRAKLA